MGGYRRLIFFVIPLSFFLVSCLSSRKEAQIKEQVWKLKTRVVHLENTLAKRDAKFSMMERKAEEVRNLYEHSKVNNDEAKSVTAFLKAELATLRMSVDQTLLQRLESIEREVLELNSRIASLSTSPRRKQTKEPRNRTKSKAVKERKKRTKENPNKIYKRVRAAYKSKKYSVVIESLNRFEQKFTNFSKLDEILYLRAESLYKSKKYQRAALSYNQVLENFEKGVFAPAAQMRMGDCYRALGEKGTAIIYYEEFLEKYKTSRYKNDVSERLKKLSGKSKKR